MLDTTRVFTSLSEEFVELFMKHHPVAATEAGIHDYDHILPNDSPDGLRERSAWLRDIEQRLITAVAWDELPLEGRVDYALLRSRIAGLRADLEEIHITACTPATYLMRAFQGVHLLLARPFAPLDERKEAAVARLMAVPEYLESVQQNMDVVPPLLLETGLEMASHGPAFVDDAVRTLMRQFPGEAERLEHAASLARKGFLRFHDFMDRELRPKADGTFAIGERWMDYKLEREHLLPYTCAELESLGREHIERTRTLLEVEARRVDPKRSWRDLIAEGRRRAPEPNGLREAYSTEVDRARRFVVDRHLAPLPAGEKLDIVETPVFVRPITPYATYQGATPFDAETEGQFYVTPIDLRRSRTEQTRQLAAHCLPMLPLVALHETYPGHHLQLCHANRAGSRLRRISSSPIFSEGWALYCEELMSEQGYFTTDPLTRLFQLRNTLWRACRVVIDAGLHTGHMTVGEAETLLEQEAMLDGPSARSEVRRYAMTPTDPMSYLVGKLALLDLRDEARQRLAGRFDLHEFHAALLASGTLPPALVREELWPRLGLA